MHFTTAINTNYLQVENPMTSLLAVLMEWQSPTLECVDLLTDEEDDSDPSHIAISTADIDKNLDNDDEVRAVECIIMGHQEMSSSS